MNLARWLEQARQRLAPGSEQPGLEASVLASFVLQKDKTWIFAHPDRALELSQQSELDALLESLIGGEPLPYLIGRQEFFGLTFAVTPAVLIPRPETELLVEQALAWLRANPNRRAAADVGTGSGCIAISLACHVRDLHISACDRSYAALELAKKNAYTHCAVSQLDFIQADLLSPFQGPFDLVCANLPYIPSSTLQGLAVAAHEPLLALDGGPDGLDFIRRLISDAQRWLNPGGLILLEIEASQGQAACALGRAGLPAAKVELLPDLAGLDRLVRIENL